MLKSHCRKKGFGGAAQKLSHALRNATLFTPEALTPLNNSNSDKNYFIAIVLSFLILIGYPFFLRWIHPPTAQNTTTNEEPAPNAETEKISQAAQKMEAAKKSEEESKPTLIPFHNDLYDIQFSTQGGTIQELAYKGEKTKAHMDYVEFYVPGKPHGNFEVRLLQDDVDLSRVIMKLYRSSENTFEFVYEKPEKYRFTKIYTIHKESPTISLQLKFENLQTHDLTLPLELTYGLTYHGYDDLARSKGRHLAVNAVVYQEKVKTKNIPGIQKKGFFVSGSGIEWGGVVEKYFAILVKPDAKILSQESRDEEETLYNKVLLEPISLAPNASKTEKILIYAGPQRYEILKNLHEDFELILSRGFFGLFKIWLLIGLKFFYGFVHNWGWAIILMTLALKLAFTPLTHMSYDSMRKMQAVQPKLKSIQERYKNDPQKQQREMMELYRRNKVNPMGGCLPMVAQIPVFIAFYQVLSEAIELKGAPFIYWIHDLAEPDKLLALPFTIPFVNIQHLNLLPFLMIGSMVWQQKLTPQASTSPEQAKMMQFMPIMMGVLFYNLPSGLVLYWFLNNTLTIIHQLVIKRMGDVILHHEDRD